MGRIILTRSATTDFDEQQRIVGNLDIPINVRGQAELAELARELKGQDISVIYAAAGSAARESAEYLGEILGAKVKVLDKLTNVDFGLWQGLPVAEVRRKHPRVFKQWEESPCAICPPAGETIEQALERVQKSLKSVLKKAQSETILLIAPDPLRSVIRCYLKRTELAKIWQNGQAGLWEQIEFA